MGSLAELDLDGTQVTDAGLEHLKGMTILQLLYLNDTQITDVGLGHLKGLPNLDSLHLNGTQVTDRGIESLRLALPNCHISSVPQP